jgi:hypothetical protein
MSLPNTPLPPILGGLQLHLAQIGTTIPPLPNTGRYCYASALKGGFLYGDAFFWNNTLTQNSYYSTWGMQGYRIKRDGSNCMYMDFARLNSGGLQFNPYSPNLFQIGPNLFVMTGSGGGPLIQYQMPDMFQSGQTLNVSAQNVNAPPPCGVGSLQSTFYVPSQNLVAYEFVQPFEVASNIYASIYSTSPTLQLINAGFIANVEPGQNAFDLTSQSLPPYVSSEYQTGAALGNLAFQGGNSFYFSNGESNPYYLGGTGLQIVQDKYPLVCDQNSPNYGTYVTTTNAFNWSSDQLTQVPAWNNIAYGSTSFNGFVSENPNIFVMGVGNGNQLLIFSPFFIAIFNLNVNVTTGVLFKDGTLIALDGNAAIGNQGFPIYMAQIPMASYGLQLRPVIIFEGQGTANINYTRPISLRGAYKA